MTRRESRELAFIILFEKSFHKNDITTEEILENAKDSREISINEFSKTLIDGTEYYLISIDDLISKNSHKWKKERISRVSFAILRIAVFEMCFYDDTPQSVAINEAVELSKKYGGEEDSSFVNGVLSGIHKQFFPDSNLELELTTAENSDETEETETASISE